MLKRLWISNNSKLFTISLILLALIGTAVHYKFGYSHQHLSCHAFGTDDAYVAYRYASNLLSGNGLTFNPGEYVEGYTDFLYVLILSVLLYFFPDNIYPASVVFNAVCYAVMLYIFYSHLKKRTNTTTANLGLMLLCLNPILWAWPGSGLETSAVLLLQVAMLIAIDKFVLSDNTSYFLIFLCIAFLGILLRADGFVFPLVVLITLFLKGQFRRGIQGALIILIFTGTYIFWRYSYYGEILPNTYYMKVSGSIAERFLFAIGQLGSFMVDQSFFLYFAVLAISLLVCFSKIVIGRSLALNSIPLFPLVGLGFLIYWLYIGGDSYNERFLLILIPIAVATLTMSMNEVFPGKAKLVVLIVFVLLQFLPLKYDKRFQYQTNKYDLWVELGKYLQKKHPGAVLAIDAAGKVPYYSKFYIVDMLGLNDKHIARTHATGNFLPGHNKFDPDYVLGRYPKLIAAWVRKGNHKLDLKYGLTQGKYESYGYKLKYVVNAAPYSKENNVIDVTKLSNEQILNLRHRGYVYYVLIKTPADRLSQKPI